MKKILVPFDFSDASFDAVHHAIRIAQQTEAQLTFLCSRQLPATEDAQPGPDAASSPDEHHPVRLWQRLQDTLQESGVGEKPDQVRYLFQEPLEGDSLETALQGSTYDLLVVGTEGAEGQTLLPWERWMVQRMTHIPTPVLVVPHRAPSQSIGVISLVTDSMNMREKQALTVLFDLTQAFGAHLQVIYVGHQKREAYSFRHAVKQLGLAPRLDAIRHTYHFVQPFRRQELEEMVSQSNTNWLVLFEHRQPAKPDVDALRRQIARSRVPLLLLPFTEEVVYQIARPAVNRERVALTDAR